LACFLCFLCFFQAFFDDFSMIFEGFASKEKIKQNLGNHRKIIEKSSKNHRDTPMVSLGNRFSKEQRQLPFV